MKRIWFLLLLFLSLSKSVDDDEFAIKIFREGERLEREGEYLAAGDAFYLALTNGYPNLEKAFSRFEKAFLSRGKREYAYYLIGRGYEAQNDMKNAKSMYRQGLSRSTSLSRMDFVNALESDVSRTSSNVMEYRDIYARANEYLQNRRYDLALKSFEQLTFMRPDVTYFYASFVYLRSRVCDWSEYVNCILCSTSSSHSNSRRYDSNMFRLEALLKADLKLLRKMNVVPKFPVAEPHMLLAMPISPMLKLDIARHRANDEMRRVRSGNMIPYT